jgi:hypothetical protein
VGLCLSCHFSLSVSLPLSGSTGFDLKGFALARQALLPLEP